MGWPPAVIIVVRWVLFVPSPAPVLVLRYLLVSMLGRGLELQLKIDLIVAKAEC